MDYKNKRKVENILKLYPIYKTALATLYPSFVSAVGDEMGGSMNGSITERYGVDRADKSNLVDTVDKAMMVLNPLEREVVEATYFNPENRSVNLIYTDLDMSQRAYYRFKRSAIEKLYHVIF